MTRLLAHGWWAQAVDATLAPTKARDVLIAGQMNNTRFLEATAAAVMSGTVTFAYEGYGGSNFNNGWDPDATNTYAVAAGDALAGMKNPTAIIWTHYTSDAASVTLAPAYGANLSRLLGYLWSRANKEVEVFVLGIHSGATATYASTVRAQQEAVCAKFASAHFVNPDNIADFDGVNYGATTGEALMSARMAAAAETARL